MSNPENIHAHLKQGGLGSLLVELQKIKTLNQAIRPLLPEQFRDCSQISRIQKGCATLDVPNGSMATIMRFELPKILSELRKDKNWLGLASIKCRVNTPIEDFKDRIVCERAPKEPVDRPAISSDTREQLEAMANTIDDEELRAAMLGLASHL